MYIQDESRPVSAYCGKEVRAAQAWCCGRDGGQVCVCETQFFPMYVCVNIPRIYTESHIHTPHTHTCGAVGATGDRCVMFVYVCLVCVIVMRACMYVCVCVCIYVYSSGNSYCMSVCACINLLCICVSCSSLCVCVCV